MLGLPAGRLAATAAGFLLALSAGCSSPQAQHVASTIEVGGGAGDGSLDGRWGASRADLDSESFWVTVRPLAFLEPPRAVVLAGAPKYERPVLESPEPMPQAPAEAQDGGSWPASDAPEPRGRSRTRDLVGLVAMLAVLAGGARKA